MTPAGIKQDPLERLSLINPVAPTSRGTLIEHLERIRPELPELHQRGASRRPTRLLGALAVAALLGAGGVAVAAEWTPFSVIGAADRPSQPADALSPAAKEQVPKHELSPTGVVGTRLVDDARRLGILPDGREVHLVPTSANKLCLVVADGGGSCYAPLSREEPITLATSKAGPGAPHIIWGAASDDVVAVSFKLGGHPVTASVDRNFYAWEGLPAERMNVVSDVTVTYADGSTRRVR
jgi:hypothetical protein